MVKDELGHSRALQLDIVRPFPGFTLVAVWFLAALGGAILFWEYPRQIGLYYWLMSLLLGLVCALDHRAERRNQAVTGDASMLFLAGLGGWPGALLGAYLFRLHARSALYVMMFVLIMLGHLGLVGWSLTPQGMQTLQPILQSALALWPG